VGFNRKSFYPDIFRNVAWSTAAVFAETRERLRAATLAVHVLPECIDADTKEDLIALLDRNAGRGAFPRTFALLEHHRKDIRR
jgi:glycosyltransferase A (GT-A) superfamily protein (DUF2064 family)